MAWVKIDDHFDEHPKLAKVGPLGWGIWLAGLSYCNRNLTDGFIPRSKAHILASFDIVDEDSGQLWNLSRTCGMSGDEIDAPWVIAILVNAAIWDEVPGGYQIHDYSDYQPTKAQILEERERKAAAGKAGGQASAEARAQAAAKGRRKPRAQAQSNPVPVPVPVPSVSGETEKKTPKPPLDPAPTEPQAASAARLTPPVDPPVDLAMTRTAKQQASDVAFARKLSLFEAWCRGIGLDPDSDEASVGRDIAFRQLKALVDQPSPTAEEFEACTRYLAGQSWRDETPKVPTVINGYGGWVAKNRPTPEANRPAPADARRGLVAG